MSSFKKPLFLILIIGVLIRLLLSSITFHPDIAHFDLAGHVFGKGYFLNFYDYSDSVFNYPPAVYFTVGIFNWMLTSWIDHSFHDNFLFHFPDTLGDLRLHLHLFLLKIPYLPFDIATALMLYKFFSAKREKFLAFTFWIFNPWVLYSTYMMGQFDVIPTFFVILALFVATRDKDSIKKIFLAATLLGIGASFKVYPLLFLLPVASFLNSWPKRLLAVFGGILVYLITILPFIGSVGFRSQALVANQSLKSLYAQIPISGGESIILFLVFICFFYFIFLNRIENYEDLWKRIFIILLLFFIFTHYHPQWFLWLTPFLIIELIRSNFKHLFLMILITISFLGQVFLFEQSLSIGLFAPLNPKLYNGFSLWQLLNLNVDINFLRSLAQSLFVGVAGYFIYYYFPKKSG